MQCQGSSSSNNSVTILDVDVFTCKYEHADEKLSSSEIKKKKRELKREKQMHVHG